MQSRIRIRSTSRGLGPGGDHPVSPVPMENTAMRSGKYSQRHCGVRFWDLNSSERTTMRVFKKIVWTEVVTKRGKFEGLASEEKG